MMEHFADAQGVPHVFIRFNPDSYMDPAGNLMPSCWGKTPKTQEPRIEPKQKAHWEARLQKLAQTVNHYVQNTPEKEMNLVELFY